MEFIKIITLSQILQEIPKIKNKVYFLAGGTDLMIAVKDDMLDEDAVIADINGLAELKYIKNYTNYISIGTLTTFSEIIKSSIVKRYAPLLAMAAKLVGSVQIRNRGTIGGNIANASPAGDSIPALFAYDAEVVTLNGKYKITDFFTGVKQNRLKNGEFIKEIKIPKIKGKTKNFFYKSSPRQAVGISKASLAVVVRSSGKKISDIRIAAGAVGKTVIRATETEKYLIGKSIDKNILSEAQEILKNEISPITDFRSTENYRRRVTSYFLEKALTGKE